MSMIKFCNKLAVESDLTVVSLASAIKKQFELEHEWPTLLIIGTGDEVVLLHSVGMQAILDGFGITINISEDMQPDAWILVGKRNVLYSSGA